MQTTDKFDHMISPLDNGRHPAYGHLVMAEIEPHHGMYIFTMSGFDGDALLSEDDARHIFGDQFDAEFAYISDEHAELLGQQD